MEQTTQVTICPAITRSGERCQRHIEAGMTFCHLHDPARAEERRVLATKASRSRPLSESAKMRRQLLTLAGEVKRGEVDPKVANCIGSLYNVAIGSLRLDAKLREVEELEDRLRAVETVLDKYGRGTRR